MAGKLAKYASFGVLPPSHVCGHDWLYHATISVSSCRNAVLGQRVFITDVTEKQTPRDAYGKDEKKQIT